MCSNDEISTVNRLLADLRLLVAVDVDSLSDMELRSQTLALLAATHQLQAALTARVGAFDARGQADELLRFLRAASEWSR